MDKQINKINKLNEYSFRWGKQFAFLTLKTLNTRLTINCREVVLDVDRYYFGLLKGKSARKIIPLASIESTEIKTLLSYSDLVVSGIYLLGAIFLNPLFFLIVPLCIYACLNSNIVIETKEDDIIKIPCFNKSDAKDFTSYIHDIYLA